MVAEPHILSSMAFVAVLLVTCSVYVLLSVWTLVTLRRSRETTTSGGARSAEAGREQGDTHEVVAVTPVTSTVTSGKAR